MLLATCLLVAPAIADDPSDDLAEMAGMPRMHSVRNQDFYPPPLIRNHVEGRVLLAFYITPAGAPDQVKVIWAENQLLVPATLHLLANLRFDVPSDWSTGELRWKRWRIGATWRLLPSTQSDQFAVSAARITISASFGPVVRK